MKAKPRGDAVWMDLSGLPGGLRTWSRPFPRWEMPWHSSQSKREPEKPLRKGRKAARLFCTHSWGTMGSLSMLRALWASSSAGTMGWGAITAQGHHLPLSQWRSTILLTPCRNQCAEIQNSPTRTTPVEGRVAKRRKCSIITKLT